VSFHELTFFYSTPFNKPRFSNSNPTEILVMDKLNEYLQSLVNTCSYELHLEPNRPPYLVSSTGLSDLQNAAILGNQISQLVFPLIPAEVKKELPNKEEVQFVHPHNLGDFNFTIKKSPAGFMVSVTPILDVPQTSNSVSPTLNNELIAPTVASNQTSISQEVAPPTAENITPQTLAFENLKSAPQIVPEPTYQMPELIVQEPQIMVEPITPLPQIETSPVNDPEFITTFSDTSTYEPPGKSYDYLSETVPPVSYETPQFVEAPQAFETPQYSQAPQFSETPQYSQPIIEPQVPQSYQIPQIQEQFEVAQPVPTVQQPQFVQTPQFVAPSTQTDFVPASANPQARAKMDAFFYKMAELKSSDLHLSVSMPPMVRKDGRIQPLEANQAVLDPETMKQLLTSIMPAKNQEEFERRHDTDFAYEIKGLARFRANIFMDRKGMGGVFRIIPSKILTAQDLGLSQHILNLCDLSKGLVLVTGPTGSGKSTTLCAMIDHINQNRDDHLITIEDPIEFTHENKKCLVNQREVHNHTDSFKDALRAALREDPDILLVGEMRDLETISIAIETAETGHLVFGTLHTTTAVSTVDRIIDQFPADRQQQVRVMLSESLRGVIAQTLLPKKGGGRIAALEVLIVTPAVSNLIREGKTFQIASSMQTGKNVGMVMLNDALFEHVKNGLVEPRDAYIKAVDKTGFEAMLTKGGFKI
jgi:twitching motility protein PilT